MTDRSFFELAGAKSKQASEDFTPAPETRETEMHGGKRLHSSHDVMSSERLERRE